MTHPWTARRAVVEALEAAGWTPDPELPLTLARHPLGAVFSVYSETGGCGLDLFEASGPPADFPGDIPDAVVIAACLAASHSEPTAALGLELYEEQQDHARTRLALDSAKRRARRRLPHEREGLIFHLERRNRRLEGLINVANAATVALSQAGEEAGSEAYALRERVSRLQARVRDLETQLNSQARPEPAAPSPADIRADAFQEAAGRIANLPQDYELDPGRGDAVRLLNGLAAGVDRATVYPPVFPWARLMDQEDLEEFVTELRGVTAPLDENGWRKAAEDILAAVEAACATWRAIAEAQHAHNTAPGPDAPTPV
ncbi:hypothetical protein [Streptomyces alfalfae]